MKTITSVTVFNDAVGLRMSATYSEVDENGQIVTDNKRFDRVITDTSAKKAANTLMNFAQSMTDGME